MAEWTPHELDDLAKAKALLENPGIAASLTNLLGTPLEKGFRLLPANWNDKVQAATRRALEKALAVALGTMADQPATRAPGNRLHKGLVAATGAGGGAFGLAALVLELPISTTIMLRSIADVARSQGEDLASIPGKLACLEVFALGGRSPRDDASESGYFLVRAALAKAIGEATEHIAARGAARESAPALVRLISVIAARFGVVVSEKAAAVAVPVLGAAGGAAINVLFLDHFQKMALGHFIIRRLERMHGGAAVKAAYLNLPARRERPTTTRRRGTIR